MSLKGHLQYLIREGRDGWHVIVGGQDIGEFRGRAQALEAAIADADPLCRMGYHAEILMHGAGGERHRVWASRPRTAVLSPMAVP